MPLSVGRVLGWTRLPWATERWRDALLIGAAWALPLAVLRPLQDAPFVDDWTYAWSVEHLLETGRIRVLDWSTSLNVAHVLWGALFCWPLGFSFTALRLSTWTAALLGLLALHGLLRDLGASRRDALFGVALLAVYPVHFVLAFTFMTDVPFLAAVTGCCQALTAAGRRGSPAALLRAALLACVAVAVRPAGIVLAGVLGVAAWRQAAARGARGRRLALALLPVAAALALLLARPHLTVTRADLTWIENSPPWRLAHLRYGLLDLHRWLVVALVFLVETVGIALAPLALGSLTRASLRAGLLLAALLGLAVGGAALAGWATAAPLTPGSTWGLRELGSAERLVGLAADHPGPRWWPPAARALGTALLAIAMAPVLRRGVPPDARPLAWAIAGYALLVALLWFFHDRYALPVVALAVALRLGAAPLARWRLALLGVLAFAAVSAVGTWDQLQYSRALWTAVGAARQAGIPARELDGGYVVNGWLQYAHPEQARRGPTGDVLVPGITDGPTRFAILNAIPPGARVLAAVRYRRVLAPSGAVYLVERVTPRPPPDGAAG